MASLASFEKIQVRKMLLLLLLLLLLPIQLLFPHLKRQSSENLRVSFHQRQMHLSPVLHHLCAPERSKRKRSRTDTLPHRRPEGREKFKRKKHTVYHAESVQNDKCSVQRLSGGKRFAVPGSAECRSKRRARRVSGGSAVAYIPGSASSPTEGRPWSRPADETLHRPRRPTIARACRRRLGECCTVMIRRGVRGVALLVRQQKESLQSRVQQRNRGLRTLSGQVLSVGDDGKTKEDHGRGAHKRNGRFTRRSRSRTAQAAIMSGRSLNAQRAEAETNQQAQYSERT